jgi:hypothetical protein
MMAWWMAANIAAIRRRIGECRSALCPEGGPSTLKFNSANGTM